MKPVKTFDHERISLNVGRLRSHGHIFELALDPDKAVLYKQGKVTDVHEVLNAQKVFFDVKKGLLAGEDELEQVFATTDVIEIAKRILSEGEIQFTAEYRQSLREAKQRKLVELIHRTFIDPKTKLPHPQKRIENAFEEVKVRLDDFKKAEEQLNDVVKQLRTVLPLTTETKLVSIHVPANYANKVYGTLKEHTIQKESWNNDGSLTVELSISASLYMDLLDALNSQTHGSIEVTER